ncbi:hypothetical protein V8C44DRAFT_326266 [Trichoderma aethiopicum]
MTWPRVPLFCCIYRFSLLSCWPCLAQRLHQLLSQISIPRRSPRVGGLRDRLALGRFLHESLRGRHPPDEQRI